MLAIARMPDAGNGRPEGFGRHPGSGIRHLFWGIRHRIL